MAKSDDNEVPLTAEQLDRIIEIAAEKDENVRNLINPGVLHRCRRESAAHAGTFCVVPTQGSDGVWASWFIHMSSKVEPKSVPLMGVAVQADGSKKTTIDMEERKDLLALTKEQYFEDKNVRAYLNVTDENQYEKLIHSFDDNVVVQTDQESTSALYAYYQMTNSSDK